MTLSNTFNRHSAEWKELKKTLTDRKADLVESLISQESDEVRGRIKEIDNILSLDKKEEAQIAPPMQY